ncbi:MAG: MFS transporter [Rhodospirillaceae bacterium TMED8]|nr:MFS transporter [Magnetovibrio sp.]OUT47973.1 MAG: MFS transporter [Rhodospirillaceae bacterium TMED8]
MIFWSAEKKTKGLICWCLFDWANSAFPTIIITFVFAAYFTQGVAVNEIKGTSQWGYAMGLSGVAIAICGPIFGKIADRTQKRKPWVAIFTLIAIIGAFLLWWVKPDEQFALRALICVAIANFAFEMSMVFYNSMLPGLAPIQQVGRWSGWGWGLGYAGGLFCLVIVLFGFVQAETPWLGLEKNAAEHLRAAGPIAALWMAVFAVPLFLFTPDSEDKRLSSRTTVPSGLRTVLLSLRILREHKEIVWFLAARMFYTDGLNTLFAFGGIYAAGTFSMTLEEVIIFGIAMNCFAGLGAFMFAWVDDKRGSRFTIVYSVLALIIFGTAILVVQSKTMFLVFALLLAIFIGPAQSASRSMMARLAPADLRGEFFGLYALSGKATAFLGPAIVGLVTDVFQSQRIGMATIIGLFAIGIILLFKVPDQR